MKKISKTLTLLLILMMSNSFFGQKRKLVETKNIENLKISLYEINKEENVWEFEISNKKTSKRFKIEYYPEYNNISSLIEFKDLDFDKNKELLIFRGSPFAQCGFKIYDYKTLKEKNIFKTSKDIDYIFIKKNGKEELTNNIIVGCRSTYKLNKKNKTIEFGSACGASCTSIEIYKFNKGYYELKEYKRIEEDKITEHKKY